MRADHEQVAAAMQALLPAPYDPYAIELRSRALDRAAVPETAWEDDPWKPVLERLSASALERRFATVGAVEIAAWAVDDVHSAFASIDQDVIAGVAQRAHHAVQSFSDLSQELAPHTVLERLNAAVPWHHVDTSASAMRPLIGSIGEETVLRHLHAAGVESHLAPQLNTPGWDLTLGGHFVNVKTWGEVSGLSSHFDKYPGTAAVVPVDASGIPEHALHFDPSTKEGLDGIHNALDAGNHGTVIVDNAFSGGAVHEHLQHAETLATHGEAVALGHLPYVTMALSGIREFDLLMRGKTDFASAAKNAALDATGTGFGGAVGAKAGMIVGTIICPGFGTAIGGLAGGIFGAMKGRKFTGEIKQRPFKEAAASYESAHSEFQSQAKIHEAEASSEFNKARRAQQLQLNQRAHKARQSVEETKEALQSRVINDSWLQPDEACALMMQCSNELTGFRTSIQRGYQSVSWWRKVLWPDVGTLAQQQALAFLRQIERKLGELHLAASTGKAVSRGQLMALLGAVGVMKEQTVAGLEKIYAAQRERDAQARSVLGEALSVILRERQEAEAQLNKKLEALRAAIRKAMRPTLETLNTRIECAKLEGAKLGLSL